MSGVRLVIGDKTRSSWSLRPWLFLKHHHVPFSETVIELERPETKAAILKHSPAGRVPVLINGAHRIWESLAICEYAAETFALQRAWPLEPAARAQARSVAAEMHAGFADLRRELPFNAHRKPEPKSLSSVATNDVARICAIWREARNTYGKGHGDWLFGAFGIADAMFAPVALRFHVYNVQVQGPEMDYVYAVLAHPAVQEWVESAQSEKVKVTESNVERTAEMPPLPMSAVPESMPVSGTGNIKIKSVILPPD